MTLHCSSPEIRIFIVATLVAGGVARADEKAGTATTPDETIYVIDDRPDGAARDRDRLLGDAPFLTIIHADEHGATTSVAEALATTAGVLGRSLGGLGAYQTVSIRGASAGHTAVLVDGVPLARIAAVTTDLGRFSLDSFGEIELYRGAVPIELGGAGIGGAVNLVTRLGRGDRGERFRASAGYGSYGARHLRAHYGDEHEGIGARSATTIGYTGADGDFTYFSDNGTLLNKNDDAYFARANNGFDQLDVSTRFGATETPLVGGARLSLKRQGLPGTIANPTSSAQLSTIDVLADVQGEVTTGAAVARNAGFVLAEYQVVEDSRGELGLGNLDRTYTTLSLGASSTWSLPMGVHRATVGLEARADRFSDRDDSGMQDALDGSRAGGAASLGIDLALSHDLVITPALRIDGLRTNATPMTVGPNALAPIAPRWDVVPSPRFTARLSVTDDVAIKGSSGWYTRLPTMIEVFGNRGFIVGAPDLRAEHGPSSDVGVVWAPSKAIGAFDRVLVQADVFANRSHDTIAFVTYAGYTARAINLDDTQAYGGELVAAARIAERVSMTASYTRLVTAQLSDDPTLHEKPIPRRPAHQLYGRAGIGGSFARRDGTLWIDTTWQSESTLDRASLIRVPGRALVGAGARVEIGAGFAIAVSVANLTDRRITYLPLDPAPSPTFTEAATPLTDVTGFPLPGRSFYLALDWTH
ncbi:MAG: TonB-dependent receptor [Kofleriaceae bacterium]